MLIVGPVRMLLNHLLLILLLGLQVSAQQSHKQTKEQVELVCPALTARQTSFLTLPCTSHKDCLFGDLCCITKPGARKSHCFQGVPKPLPELPHMPLLGVVPLTCPNPPVLELLEVTKCEVDADCWPRICCPDGRHRFCRTPAPHWEKIPQHRKLPVLQMLRGAMSYLQCTDKTEGILDLFPRSCVSARDCFPDLCCQEGARKVCRRPRASILSLFSSLGARARPAVKQGETTSAPSFFLPFFSSATKSPPRRNKTKTSQVQDSEENNTEVRAKQ